MSGVLIYTTEKVQEGSMEVWYHKANLKNIGNYKRNLKDLLIVHQTPSLLESDGQGIFKLEFISVFFLFTSS